jgi:predicted Rossmann-fold nucleotide-binding protein
MASQLGPFRYERFNFEAQRTMTMTTRRVLHGVEEQRRVLDGAALPSPGDLPYQPVRQDLYTPAELLEVIASGPVRTRDDVIYAHVVAHGGHFPDPQEAFFQHLHDYSMDEALARAIGLTSSDRLNLIAFMGGHATSRNDPDYRRTAETAYRCIKEDFRVASGGGPGIMEAANLGAYFACNGYAVEDLQAAVSVLGAGGGAVCPDMGQVEPDPEKQKQKEQAYAAYLAAAESVRRRYPARSDESVRNVAVPTWFYGWEPTNNFAQQVAKYFSNGLREDGLVAIGVGGIIFAPGGPGTTQEIFMDAAQNAYQTHNYSSAMVFLGTQRYSFTAHCALVKELAALAPWGNLLFTTDSPADAVRFLRDHHPIPKP